MLNWIKIPAKGISDSDTHELNYSICSKNDYKNWIIIIIIRVTNLHFYSLIKATNKEKKKKS